MSVSISPVTPADRAEWERLFLAYGAFYKTDLPPQVIENVWGWINDPQNPFWADIARTGDGRAVGLVQYQLMHRSLGGSMTCYLSDLFTDPEIRGSGAGRAMIDHVIAFARARDLPAVRWLTAEDNATARRLYDTYAPRTPFVLYSVPTRT
ncbi:GNAT family N-acetyltransferase [Paracoccus pacificus]|uniref:GNAT family N-acetyltransferase n=1 Tax=Paracoccus pacificus TaxID=1463598 RepID=A0ABW4R2E0_9RHOB